MSQKPPVIGSIPASAADAAKSAGFFSEVERVFRAFPAVTTLFGASLIGVRPTSCVHSDSISIIVFRSSFVLSRPLPRQWHWQCRNSNSSICFLFAQAFLYLRSEVKAIDTKLVAGFKEIDTKIDRLGSNILATLDGIHNARYVAAEVGHAVAASPTANRPRPPPPPPPP